MTDDNGPEKNQKCVFPFIYEGQTFEDCTNEGEKDPSKFWCATEVDGKGALVVIVTVTALF